MSGPRRPVPGFIRPCGWNNPSNPTLERGGVMYIGIGTLILLILILWLIFR